MHRCQKCDKQAKYFFSPDLDIRGLGACEEHKEEVQMEYFIMMSDLWNKR